MGHDVYGWLNCWGMMCWKEGSLMYRSHSRPEGRVNTLTQQLEPAICEAAHATIFVWWQGVAWRVRPTVNGGVLDGRQRTG